MHTSSPYLKARGTGTVSDAAISHMRHADYLDDDSPPEGRDPVDWLLFDHPEGTCGVFSTAFVQ